MYLYFTRQWNMGQEERLLWEDMGISGGEGKETEAYFAHLTSSIV